MVEMIRLSRDGVSWHLNTDQSEHIFARFSVISVVKRRRRQEPVLQLPETV
jgi:hypothetical protein